MSMPSDVTEDVTEAVERVARPRRPRARGNPLRKITVEQYGWAAATIIAFLGVAHLGPRLHRLIRPETTIEKARRKAIEARREAERYGRKAGKRVRRLGGGAIRH